jgi:hypothetical protein
MEAETKGYKKTKDSRDKIYEVHSRIEFIRLQTKLGYFRRIYHRHSWKEISMVYSYKLFQYAVVFPSSYMPS